MESWGYPPVKTPWS